MRLTLSRPRIADEAAPDVYVASPLRLTWWKFRQHRLAVASGIVIALLYGVVAFAEFFAPFPPDEVRSTHVYAPPQTLHLFDTSDGSLRFAPFVYGYRSEVDTAAMRRTFTLDETQRVPVQFFARGASYRLLGLIETDLHLIGPTDPTQPMYLLGADRLGRDVLSRMIYGARISLTVGLIGVGLSLMIGLVMGGISGYYGGPVDALIQRTIDFIRSLPTIPLWLGISAALPLSWPPLGVYFAITLILSLIGWTTLARVVRGRFLALREEDFVVAARLMGCRTPRIIFRHMLPAMASHIIAAVTLAIPSMILGETALSFLGLGLRAPIVSWGVMLQDAQSLRVVATAPWLLWPAAAVIVAVLALNFLGDGLRDAADPYA